jgi:hypothetical protein
MTNTSSPFHSGYFEDRILLIFFQASLDHDFPASHYSLYLGWQAHSVKLRFFQ